MPTTIVYNDPALNANNQDPSMGKPIEPWWMVAMADQPHPVVAAWYQTTKGKRTILRGGWSETPIPEEKSFLGHFYRQQIDPRSWTRYSHQNIYTKHNGPIGGLFYDSGKDETKFIGKFLEKRAAAAAQSPSALNSTITSTAQKLGMLSPEGKAHQVLEGGLMARIKAYGRPGAHEMDTGTLANMSEFTRTVYPELAEAAGKDISPLAAKQLMLGSVKGGMSQRVTGFVMGSRGEIDPAARAAFEQVGSKALLAAADTARASVTKYGTGYAAKQAIWVEARQGTRSFAVDAAGEATEQFGKKAFGMAAKEAAPKILTSLGVDISAWAAAGGPVDVVGDALLIASFAKLGVDLGTQLVAKPAIRLSSEGFRSWKGQLDKAPMGMGFRDNTVAQTSRQRGVMAISNSRLNARSALGAEASMMHARYG